MKPKVTNDIKPPAVLFVSVYVSDTFGKASNVLTFSNDFFTFDPRYRNIFSSSLSTQHWNQFYSIHNSIRVTVTRKLNHIP